MNKNLKNFLRQIFDFVPKKNVMVLFVKSHFWKPKIQLFRRNAFVSAFLTIFVLHSLSQLTLTFIFLEYEIYIFLRIESQNIWNLTRRIFYSRHRSNNEVKFVRIICGIENWINKNCAWFFVWIQLNININTISKICWFIFLKEMNKDI